MAFRKQTMDGNEAAAYISYAFTEVATIYPITPSSPMAENVDEWSANGKKNIFGQTVRLVEMQSEAGAAGAMHGSLESGALTASYTASQGLLLMIPTMYRMSGQLHPGVLHVSSRTVGTHAFSIFGDHSDVMSCRQTGFAMLSTSGVQEVMDLAGVAHLAAIKSRIPFLHFFDGFRTSHELQKIDVMEYDDLEKLVDQDALLAFRKNSLNPERPVLRSSVQNPDVFFQARESANRLYDAVPQIVDDYMQEINKLTGRDYQLFNYFGAPDAERLIIAMGSASGAIKETVDYLNNKGEKVGFVQVHLYRPFSVKHFLKSIPKSVKKIAVLDRTKEPGSLGEPLFEDICTAYINEADSPLIYGGRYGLSSKDVTPDQMVAVLDNLKKEEPKNHFTVGIEDDVTNLSLDLGEALDIVPEGTVSCKFWGLASDGTVGANKNSIKIIGDYTDMYTQAYFEYDTKKSFGVTKSHLRFGQKPIDSSYLVKSADFVACHIPSFMEKYDIVSDLKKNGTFLLNCIWTDEELSAHLPAKVKRYIANNNIKFYTMDATKVAMDLGLGNRANTVLQAAFFKLANIIPVDEAIDYMKKFIAKTYFTKGEDIIQTNYKAVDQGLDCIKEIVIPADWATTKDEAPEDNSDLPEFIRNVALPINRQKGDELPVSAFVGREDGTLPFGTSAYDKRGVAIEVPTWIDDNCIQCNQCAYVCPHAAIRPFLVNEEETQNAPDSFTVKKAIGKGLSDYNYRLQVDVLDCTGCNTCAEVCPSKKKALEMKPLEEQMVQTKNWDYALSLEVKDNPLDLTTVKGSQFEQPYLEFSGACAGCGETPYAKIVTQLYGDRMYIANGTGCSQAWGAAMPSVPYTKDHNGCGPTWSNSLFENNAEFSLGMCLAVNQQREKLTMTLEELKEKTSNVNIQNAFDAWKAAYNDGLKTKEVSRSLVEALSSAKESGETGELVAEALKNKEHLVKKSMWMYGGDGWAYDIGYGGLDHVLSTGENVNIMVFDTEVYSNTGGQSSKATPIGAVAQFASSGKKIRKKDLGLMAMSYGYVYVAQVALGANMSQLLKVIAEAEAYDGPSLIIAYAPCIAHGVKEGMGCINEETKRAVEAGYWHLYRYNPDYKDAGKNPFVLESKEPTRDFQEFLMGEVRYSSLVRTFPEEAKILFAEAEKAAKEKYETYRKLADQ